MAPHHVIQVIKSEGLAQGFYVAARGAVEPATFRTKAPTTTTQPTMPLMCDVLDYCSK